MDTMGAKYAEHARREQAVSNDSCRARSSDNGGTGTGRTETEIIRAIGASNRKWVTREETKLL